MAYSYLTTQHAFLVKRIVRGTTPANCPKAGPNRSSPLGTPLSNLGIAKELLSKLPTVRLSLHSP